MFWAAAEVMMALFNFPRELPDFPFPLAISVSYLQILNLLGVVILGMALHYSWRHRILERELLLAEMHGKEDELGLSNGRLLDMVDLISEWIVETDTRGTVTSSGFSSTSNKNPLGLPLIVGESLIKTLQPDERQAFEAFLESIKFSRTIMDGQFRFRRQDGLSITMSVKGTTVNPPASSQIPCLRFIIQDISREVQSRRDLDHSHATQDAITIILQSFSNMAEGKMDVALGSAMEQVKELLAVERCFVMRHNSDLLTLENEFQWSCEGLDYVGDTQLNVSLEDLPWLHNQLQSGRIVHVEDVEHLPDAATNEKARWLDMGIKSILIIPFGGNEELLGVLVLEAHSSKGRWQRRDIVMLESLAGIVAGAWQREMAVQELRASNTKLMDIVEFLPDPTFVIDSEHRVVAWNRAMVELTSVPKEDMIGRGDYAYAVPFYGETVPILIDHFGDADLSQWRKLYNYVEINRHTLYAETYVPFFNEGKGAHLWLTASPLFDSEGGIVGAIESLRDVTYRKRSEAALRDSRQSMANLMKNLPGMVYRCSRSEGMTLEFVSEGCRELTGHYPEVLLENGGRLFSDLVHPLDREHVLSNISLSMAQHVAFRLEHRVLQANGTDKWVLNQGKGSYNENGELTSVEGVLTDISKGVVADQARRRSEANFQLLVEKMNDGLGVVDANGRVNYVNDRLCEMTGLTTEKMVGKFVGELLPDLVGNTIASQWSGWALPHGEALELDIPRQGGGKLPVRLSPAPIYGENDVFEGGFAIISDMTSMREAEDNIRQLNEGLEQRIIESTHELIASNSALKRSEARYRRIIESLQEGYIFYSHDIHGSFTYISPSYREMLGYKNPDDMAQALQGWLKLSDNILARTCSQKSTLGFKQSAYDLVAKHKNGTKIILEILEVPVFDEHNVVISVEGIGRDVTEQRHNLELIKSAQEQLLVSDKMAALGNMVAGLSHEINTPLGIGVTAISHLDQLAINCLDAYGKGTLTKREFEEFIVSSRETSKLVQGNLNRATDLVQNFKEVASDQSSQQERIFNLGDYLRDIIQSLSPPFKNTGFRIECNCPDDLEVRIDPGALYQIFSNLVMNSLKHGFDGMLVGTINIEITRDNQGVVIDYFDNGNGMSRNQVARIYEPFFTTKRGRGGTGLGMHIVYNNVTGTLGGTISCASKPGRGTRFTISLPLLAEVEHG